MNKTASFLNLAVQSPSLELGLSVTETLVKGPEDDLTIYYCNKALKSCSVNLKHNISICNLCVFRAKKGIEIYLKHSPQTKVKAISPIDLENVQDNDLVCNLKNQIHLAVNSTIASQFRIDDLKHLEHRWNKYFELLNISSFQLAKFFLKELETNSYDNFILFNGRLSCSRPIKALCEIKKINYYLYDANFNGKNPVVSKNRMFHSLDFVYENSIHTYLNNFKDSNEIAEKFMLNKLNRNPTNDKVFTKNQIKKYIDPKLTTDKPIISIFTSSDDEYKYIGEAWKGYKVVDQIDSILELINSSVLNENFQIVIKMHPNQKGAHRSSKKRYENLSKTALVLFPENRTDTYELIEKSEIVVTFCSSVGIEANYLGKPVIQIGPSIFVKLPAVNFYDNAKEAINSILNKKYKKMPKRASVIWFTYLTKYKYNINNYSYLEDGIFLYRNKKISSPFLLRLLTYPSKIMFSIQKGDFHFIRNFNMYLYNFVFGTNKVK